MKEHKRELSSAVAGKIAVVGLGYVGLPLALLFVHRGFDVIGIDLDAGKVGQLSAGRSYIQEIPDSSVQDAMASGRLTPVTLYSAAQDAEAIIICVPTPLTEYGTPDLSFLTEAATRICDQLKRGQLIVLESSTYPGTTREVLLPILARSGHKLGLDYNVAYSPERVDPGNAAFPLERIPKIISGATDACLERVAELYTKVFDKLHAVSSTDAAEMAKILENSYRLINISFINEIAMLCDALQLDLWETVQAAGTKPFGFQPFYPGPGAGGHCIPVDPSYLLWKTRQHGVNSEFIQLANAMNGRMPAYIVQQFGRALKRTSLSGATVIVYGAAYKPDIGDCRESASLELIKLLYKEGATVHYHDPYVPELKLGSALRLQSMELTAELLEAADGVIIATNHSAMPSELLRHHASLIYDTRNVAGLNGGKAKVVRLGAGAPQTKSSGTSPDKQ